MKFVLLHDKNGDSVLIAVDRIFCVEGEKYGNESVTKVSVAPYDKYGEVVFHIKETVEEVYRLILEAQRGQ